MFLLKKNSTICNKISDTREAKFSISTTRIANEQFTEQTALTTTVSTSVPNKILLEKFTAYTDYSRTAKNSLLNKLCIQLQVPIQTKNRKSLVNEEILLVTQIKRQHLKDFVQIQNVELQLNHLRNIERQQMTEIQEKMAEIQNAKSVLSYPRLAKSRYVPNYVQNNDNSYYYYVPQRSHYRYPYPQYYYQNPYPYRQDQIYKYDPSFDDQRSSYSIHSSPQCLNYGGSYPRELKYNPYYYLDPTPTTSRNFSRSTDQIAMHNFANYPLEMSHSDQGLFNMAYNYPIKMNDRFAFNIDIELMQKEQRVLELEREIELRKRQIEETIRYQEELLQLAELNNVNVNEYKNNYSSGNNQQMVDFDVVNEYYINEKPSRQYSDELVNPYYPYDDLPPNHQQFASYYDNLFQQNEPRDSICYAEPVFQQDTYYSQQYPQNMDSTNIYGKHQEQNSGNTFDQQHNRYTSKPYQSEKRQACNASTQEHIDYVMQIEKDIDKMHSNNNNNIKGNYKQVRPLSGEYENVAQLDSDSVDNEMKQESTLTSVKHNQKKIEIGKPNKNYNFPTKRLLLMRDAKEKNLRGNGVGMRIIGGQLCSDGHLGAFVEQIFPGSVADRLQDQIKEGDELIEWNGVSLVGKTFEEVRSILKNDSDEIEFLVRVGSVPKSAETSKDSSEITEDNVIKNLASNYDNMNIKDNLSQPLLPTKKDNSNKVDESMSHTAYNETPTHRRTQSMKRQRAQEYETTATTQNPQKSPMKKSSINSRDENLIQPNLAYISNSSSDFPPNLPNSIPVNSIQSQLPDIKMSKTLEHSSPINKPIRNVPPQKSPEKINNLTRTDTADSKSSNSSSVTTDFLSEEQREIVRKWLGPGQLLMLSYTQRVDKVGNLPDDSLVVAELYLSLRKIAEEDILIVTANSFKNLKSKNIIEVYIKLYLMYSEQQLSRVMKRKTKPIILSDDNNFNESFNFHTQLEGMLLQVSLWSCGKGLNVHKMLGEAVIHLDDIEFVKKNSKKDVSGWYKLLKPDI